MNTPLISIIVPVYNVEKYISNSLDSILKQDFDNFEIVIINDGSTDNSRTVCKDYTEKFSNVFLYDLKNGGVSVARNFGLQMAKGDYIWFVDSDDWIEPNSLKVLAEELAKEELEILAFYENRYIEKDNKLVKPNSLLKIAKTNGNNYLKLSGRFISPLWVYLYNRRFVLENKISFIEMLLHEDDYFNLLCFSKVKCIKKIDKTLYNYRVRTNSLIRSKVSEKRLHCHIELLKLCKALEKTSLDSFFLDSQIRLYIGSLFYNLLEYAPQNRNEKSVSFYLKEVKAIVPNQNIYRQDLKGVIVEKILYNLSNYLYLKYKSIK